jgi:hypothetical protein
MVKLTVAKAEAEAATRRGGGRPGPQAVIDVHQGISPESVAASDSETKPKRPRGRPRRERPEPPPRLRQPGYFRDDKEVRQWVREHPNHPLITTSKHEQRLARLETLPNQDPGVLAYAKFESGWSYDHARRAGIPGSEIIYGLARGYLIPEGAELPPPVPYSRRRRAAQSAETPTETAAEAAAA